MKAHFEKIARSAEESFRAFRFSTPAFPPFWHYHPELELTLIERGRGRRIVGDLCENFDKGDLILLGSNLPHLWASDPSCGTASPAAATVIQFDEAILGESFLQLPESQDLQRLILKAQRGLQLLPPLSSQIAKGMKEMLALKGFPRLLKLLSLLEAISAPDREEEIRPLASVLYQLPTRHADEGRINRVLMALHGTFTEELPFQHFASLAGLSPSAFSRLFKRTLRVDFTAYRNTLRIAHACQLLRESERTIVDIAAASGFNNLSHFNRLFLRMKEVSPRQFRNEV